MEHLLVPLLSNLIPKMVSELAGSGAIRLAETSDLDEIMEELEGGARMGGSPLLASLAGPLAKVLAPVAANALSDLIATVIPPRGRGIRPAGGAMMPMGAVGSGAMMPMGSVGSGLTPAGGIIPLIPIAAALAPSLLSAAIPLISKAISGKGPVAFKRLPGMEQDRIVRRAAQILNVNGFDPSEMSDVKLAKVGRGVMVARGGIRAGSGGITAPNFSKLLKKVKTVVQKVRGVAQAGRQVLGNPDVRRVADATANILSAVGVPGTKQAAMTIESLGPVVESVLGAVDDGSLASAANAINTVSSFARGSGNGGASAQAGGRFVFE